MTDKCIRPILSRLKHDLILSGIALESVMKRRASQYQKCIYFISTPTHGNLGDHAIVYAQYLLMKEIGAEKCVVEITRWQYERNREKLTKIIRPGDIIIIDGGGNIGTLWLEEEYKMRDIIRRFPKNPIFIFPQTAFFSDDVAGRRELKQSISVYCAHPDLTIFCRDQATFHLISTHFPQVKAVFTPDMVLSISGQQPPKSRTGVLFCIRKDPERTSSETLLLKLKRKLSDAGQTVRETSTLVPRNVHRKDRISELENKWAEFSGARLIVTDRLHGMIFSAITGTPCVALDNISHKVRSGYQWLQHLPYIKFCENDTEIECAVASLLNMPSDYVYSKEPLADYYQQIGDLVLNALNNSCRR